MKQKRRYLIRLIRLEPLDDRILRDYAVERGLRPHDLSAALRLVLREWFVLRVQALSSFNKPQIVPPWDLRAEIQRIKANLHGRQPPAGYSLEPPPPPPPTRLPERKPGTGGPRRVTPLGAPVFSPPIEPEQPEGGDAPQTPNGDGDPAAAADPYGLPASDPPAGSSEKTVTPPPPPRSPALTRRPFHPAPKPGK